MVSKVEIITMPDPSIKPTFNSSLEKWIDLDGSCTIYLRVVYGSHKPVTDINFYRIKHVKGQPNKMVIYFLIEIYRQFQLI